MNDLIMWGTFIFIVGLSILSMPPKMWEYRKHLMLQRIDDLQVLGQWDKADKVRMRIDTVPKLYKFVSKGLLVFGAVLLLSGFLMAWF